MFFHKQDSFKDNYIQGHKLFNDKLYMKKVLEMSEFIFSNTAKCYI